MVSMFHNHPSFFFFSLVSRINHVQEHNAAPYRSKYESSVAFTTMKNTITNEKEQKTGNCIVIVYLFSL